MAQRTPHRNNTLERRRAGGNRRKGGPWRQGTADGVGKASKGMHRTTARGDEQKAVNPRVARRTQQAFSPCVEQTGRVVRNHEVGTWWRDGSQHPKRATAGVDTQDGADSGEFFQIPREASGDPRPSEQRYAGQDAASGRREQMEPVSRLRHL